MCPVLQRGEFVFLLLNGLVRAIISAAKYLTSTFTDLATHFGSLNQREKQ